MRRLPPSGRPRASARPGPGRGKNHGQEQIAGCNSEPNADVQPSGAACVVATAAGEMLIGLLLNENPVTITLGQPNGVPTVLSRSNLLSVQSQTWSFMPVGLEEGLSPQDMADLLEYNDRAELGLTATP